MVSSRSARRASTQFGQTACWSLKPIGILKITKNELQRACGTDQNGRCALRQFLTFPECSYGGLPFLLAKASSTSRRESERMSCPVWRAGQHLRGFSLTFIEFAPRPSAWASAQRQSVLSGGIRLDPISVSWYSTRNACVYFPRNQSTKSSPLAFPPGNDLEA
jgi:hypothetical protein